MSSHCMKKSKSTVTLGTFHTPIANPIVVESVQKFFGNTLKVHNKNLLPTSTEDADMI